MNFEKQLKVVKGKKELFCTYYVKKVFSSSFECDMYNVGISVNGKCTEIEDFSPSYEEAKCLCEKLYNENVSVENIFLVAEEFILS